MPRKKTKKTEVTYCLPAGSKKTIEDIVEGTKEYKVKDLWKNKYYDLLDYIANKNVEGEYVNIHQKITAKIYGVDFGNMSAILKNMVSHKLTISDGEFKQATYSIGPGGKRLYNNDGKSYGYKVADDSEYEEIKSFVPAEYKKEVKAKRREVICADKKMAAYQKVLDKISLEPIDYNGLIDDIIKNKPENREKKVLLKQFIEKLEEVLCHEYTLNENYLNNRVSLTKSPYKTEELYGDLSKTKTENSNYNPFEANTISKTTLTDTTDIHSSSSSSLYPLGYIMRTCLPFTCFPEHKKRSTGGKMCTSLILENTTGGIMRTGLLQENATGGVMRTCSIEIIKAVDVKGVKRQFKEKEKHVESDNTTRFKIRNKIYKIQNKDITPVRPGINEENKKEREGRVFTEITNLNREFRKHLLVNGKKIMGLDIRNSQPLLATVLIKRYWEKKGPIPHDVEQYQADCEAGRFYDYFMRINGLPDEFRSEFKGEFFRQVFFSMHTPKLTVLKKQFIARYPSCWEAIGEIKGGYYSKTYGDFAREMQKLEACLIFDWVNMELIGWGIDAFNIFDSIYVSDNAECEIARQYTMDAFASVGLSPTINKEVYNQPAKAVTTNIPRLGTKAYNNGDHTAEVTATVGEEKEMAEEPESERWHIDGFDEVKSYMKIFGLAREEAEAAVKASTI